MCRNACQDLRNPSRAPVLADGVISCLGAVGGGTDHRRPRQPHPAPWPPGGCLSLPSSTHTLCQLPEGYRWCPGQGVVQRRASPGRPKPWSEKPESATPAPKCLGPGAPHGGHRKLISHLPPEQAKPGAGPLVQAAMVSWAPSWRCTWGHRRGAGCLLPAGQRPGPCSG